MKENNQNKATVSFEPGRIKAAYSVLVKSGENNKITCYIPAFDLTYTANNDSEITSRADIMIKSFVNFYFKEDSVKNFFLAIHRLGFKAPNHNLIMKEALNKKNIHAKFASENNDIPEGYELSNRRIKETELMVA